MCLGVPGQITRITGDEPLSRMGVVEFGGVLKDVSLAGVPEAEVGDYVIVHAGFALNTIDEEEAQEVFEYLQQIAELGAEELGEAREPAPGTGEGVP